MGKMTDNAISTLYENGKKVYNGELDLNKAIQIVNEKCPEVAVSSARHYITWYSKMREGEILTWNSNSRLLLYYANRIINEEGAEEGKKAVESVTAFARHAGRAELETAAKSLLPSISNEGNNKQRFENWLKNSTEKEYTDNTIRRYSKALEKAEEWLQINLENKIFEIDDLSLFDETEEIIKSASNYREINQNHGHGDLSAALTLYRKFLKEGGENAPTTSWWPSADEYDLGFDKQKWLEILNNPDVIGPIWGAVLAMFHDYGGEATCTQIGQRYNEDPASVRAKCTQLAKRVQRETNCEAYKSGNRTRYWPILFQGRGATNDESGSYVWKLRPELFEALDEFDINRFLPKKEDDKAEMTIKAKLSEIKKYISGKGFTYGEGLVENFYLSLKSKPFVILAGTSGTGKTRLVKLFAEAIGAEYNMVSVRPDWSDGSDLFGHHDLNGNFITGPVCTAFDAANKNPSQPVILCIDEMNLARVEYYLSDFLSVIESRKKEDEKIATEPIAQYAGGIPDNLYIVGTVNMDETTFPFSKKVLDRANTIEFNYVDLTPDFVATEDDGTPLQLPNSFLRTDYLVLAQDCNDEKEYVIQICDELQKINEILKSANAHVGYRVRDEIVFYMLNNKKAGYLITEDQAMDNEIMQKILPRIQGSSVSIKNMLVELFKFCMGNYSGPDIDSGKAGEQMQAMSHAAKYHESAAKIGYMMTRYEEDGFTSYWL